MTKDSRRAQRVLFVCMGNICRSPMAEGVFRRRVKERAGHLRIKIDSAGTHSYHVGSAPDNRAQAAAARRGINIESLSARRVVVEDFERFDYILAMDSDNRYDLEDICPSGYEERLHMFMKFARNSGVTDVPDPYYGGGGGFETVLDLVEDAAEGLLQHLRREKLV